MTLKTATHITFTHQQRPSENIAPDVHISLATKHVKSLCSLTSLKQLATGQAVMSCKFGQGGCQEQSRAREVNEIVVQFGLMSRLQSLQQPRQTYTLVRTEAHKTRQVSLYIYLSSRVWGFLCQPLFEGSCTNVPVS